MKFFRAELQSCKVDNEKLMKAQAKQHKINAILVQNLTKMKHQKQTSQTSINSTKGSLKEESHKKKT